MGVKSFFQKLGGKSKKSKTANAPTGETNDFGSNALAQSGLGGVEATGSGATTLGLAGLAAPAPGINKVKGKKHVTDKEVLNGGSAHQVTKLTTIETLGTTGKNTGYFKADPKREDSDVGRAGGVGQKKGDSHMAARAVASSRLDQALGTNVLTQDMFARVGGKDGVVSAQAEGDAVSKQTLQEVDKDTYDAYFEMMGAAAVKEENGRYYRIGDPTALDVDLKDPNIQKGLSDLAVMDYLTGQLDRHSGNIFIDKDSGQVTGIDNDMAFGTTDLDEVVAKSVNEGLPTQIDKGTAEAILAMDVKAFMGLLGGEKGDLGFLTEDEKAGAKKRFIMLQAYCSLLQMSGGLVETWDDNSYEAGMDGYDDYLERSESGLATERAPNYLQRLKRGQERAGGTH